MENKLHFSSAKTFSDLFETHFLSKEEAPKDIPIHAETAQGCFLSSFCSLALLSGIDWIYVKPKKELVEAVEKNSLGIDYDSIYFKITVRDDGQALVSAQNNKIIGGPWLAVIDASTVPIPPED